MTTATAISAESDPGSAVDATDDNQPDSSLPSASHTPSAAAASPTESAAVRADKPSRRRDLPPVDGPPPLTDRQMSVLRFIDTSVRERGYPPSVREICSGVGLTSPSTVHAHLETLQRLGYLRRDPTKPRAIEVRFDPASGASADRRPVRHVPLLGEVAAGTGVLAHENVEELLPLPSDLTGEGELFMLRVRGESMIDAGIHHGDLVVVRQQSEARNGDIVVAGIPGDEATVKTFRTKDDRVFLEPSNPTMNALEFDPSEISIYGRVVTVLRSLL